MSNKHKHHNHNNFTPNMHHENQVNNDAQNDELEHIAPDSTDEMAQNIELDTEYPDDELTQLTKKYNELTDSNLRLMAEFDNYRKRTTRERADLIKTAGEKVLTEMLPLIDDFERAKEAMANSSDINAVEEGIDLIYNKFVSFLSQNGVKEIPTENEVFNPELHEAVTMFPAPTEDMKGKIIDCVSKGYMLNDKVIRFPKVVVGE